MHQRPAHGQQQLRRRTERPTSGRMAALATVAPRGGEGRGAGRCVRAVAGALIPSLRPVSRTCGQADPVRKALRAQNSIGSYAPHPHLRRPVEQPADYFMAKKCRGLILRTRLAYCSTPRTVPLRMSRSRIMERRYTVPVARAAARLAPVPLRIKQQHRHPANRSQTRLVAQPVRRCPPPR